MVRTRSTTAEDRGETSKAAIVDLSSEDEDEYLTPRREGDSDIEDVTPKKKDKRKYTKKKSSVPDKDKATSSKKSSKSSKSNDDEGEDDVDIIKIVKGSASKASSSSSSKSKGVKRSASSSKKKSDPKITKGGTRPIHSFFIGKSVSSSSSSSSSPSPEKEVVKKRKLDPGVIAFLFSGVPENVVKAQKEHDNKKEQEELLSTMAFFPRIQNAVPDDKDYDETDSAADAQTLIPKFRLLEVNEKVSGDYAIQSDISYRDHFATVSQPPSKIQICCDVNLNLQSPKSSLSKSASNSSSECVPWTMQYKSEGLKDLVCDKEGLSKLKTWLKQWKSDIKDDGGMSRKLEIKRKKGKDSDSDFITSEEEEMELKKKSVLLSGPPGSGKTTAVYVTAKHYGFHVVEVNFSSKRSGKDVLQRVEEAVLSQRVKESGSSCLLLFEDIDLLDPKEDEGFHAAIAQLITTAVRPIVMTTTASGPFYLDSKVEKKDPLQIQFQYPPPNQIVRKVFLPILQQELPDKKSKEKKIPSVYLRICDSVCRHLKGDLRQSINQLQFVFSRNSQIGQISHLNLDLVDLEFIRGSASTKEKYYDVAEYVSEYGDSQDFEEDEDEDLNLSKSARKSKQNNRMESVVEMLERLGDLDAINGMRILRRQSQFNEEEEESEVETRKRELTKDYLMTALDSSIRKATVSGISFGHLQTLILDDDDSVTNSSAANKLFDEVGEYCDNSYVDGGWETASYIRSIIKRNKKDSIGFKAKRNGRLTPYFKRLDRDFVDRVCKTFGFHKELEVALKNESF